MTNSANKYHIDMCNGPLLRKIVMFALPVMFSGMLQILFQTADIVVIGRFGDSYSLAAVGSNCYISALIICLLMGLSVGVNAIAARYFGANDKLNLIKTSHTSIFIALWGGIALGALSFLLTTPILRAVKTPEDVLPQAVVYMKICSLGIPGMALYNFAKSLMQAYGDTKRPFYYLVIAGILNVILNIAFVAFLKMQVTGVALSTAITQWLSGILTIRALRKETGATRLHWHRLRQDFSFSTMKKIMGIGLPAGIQSACFNLANVAIQVYVNSFGANAMAGVAAGSTAVGLVCLAEYSFSLSSLSFVSQNLGGKKFDRVVKSIIYCTVICSLICVLGGFFMLRYEHWILKLFVKGSDAVIAYGIVYLEVMMVHGIYIFLGLLDVSNSILYGFGKSLSPTINSIVSICLFRIFWIYCVFPRYHTIRCLLAALPASWILCVVINIIILIPVIIKTKRELEQNTPSVITE